MNDRKFYAVTGPDGIYRFISSTEDACKQKFLACIPPDWNMTWTRLKAAGHTVVPVRLAIGQEVVVPVEVVEKVARALGKVLGAGASPLVHQDLVDSTRDALDVLEKLKEEGK